MQLKQLKLRLVNLSNFFVLHIKKRLIFFSRFFYVCKLLKKYNFVENKNSNMEKGVLYLIPNLIVSDIAPSEMLSQRNIQIVNNISHYVVEDIRNARRFIRLLSSDIIINNLQFYELNKHISDEIISSYISICKAGNDLGLLSEAGLPCIADPGNILVSSAHANNIKVIPLSGPSSIYMALMASGLNGQNFAFNGYLPIELKSRINSIKELERKIINSNQTQIFIETPYRNNQLFSLLIDTLSKSMRLCVAANIGSKDEFINTKKISEWKKDDIDLNKLPCIFAIGQ